MTKVLLIKLAVARSPPVKFFSARSPKRSRDARPVKCKMLFVFTPDVESHRKQAPLE